MTIFKGPHIQAVYKGRVLGCEVDGSGAFEGRASQDFIYTKHGYSYKVYSQLYAYLLIVQHHYAKDLPGKA